MMKRNILKPIVFAGLLALTAGLGLTVYAANTGSSAQHADTDQSADADADADDIDIELPNINQDIRSPRTVTVTASASVKAVPDKAEIRFGVTTQAKTAEKAQTENAEKIDAVVAHLMESGISEKSIQTDNFNIYPVYNYEKNEPEITGYQASTTLTVRDQDIADAGSIVSEGVSVGINSVDNIRFYTSSYDEAYADALEAAVHAAEKKAGVLAKSSGGTLGSVIELTEGYQDTSLRYSNTRFATTEDSASVAAMAKGISIMPGESDITANVTVTYELR